MAATQNWASSSSAGGSARAKVSAGVFIGDSGSGHSGREAGCQTAAPHQERKATVGWVTWQNKVGREQRHYLLPGTTAYIQVQWPNITCACTMGNIISNKKWTRKRTGEKENHGINCKKGTTEDSSAGMQRTHKICSSRHTILLTSIIFTPYVCMSLRSFSFSSVQDVSNIVRIHSKLKLWRPHLVEVKKGTS